MASQHYHSRSQPLLPLALEHQKELGQLQFQLPLLLLNIMWLVRVLGLMLLVLNKLLLYILMLVLLPDMLEQKNHLLSQLLELLLLVWILIRQELSEGVLLEDLELLLVDQELLLLVQELLLLVLFDL